VRLSQEALPSPGAQEPDANHGSRIEDRPQS
jgi:hypothetical protein